MKFNILLLSQLFLCASTSHKRDQELTPFNIHGDNTTHIKFTYHNDLHNSITKLIATLTTYPVSITSDHPHLPRMYTSNEITVTLTPAPCIYLTDVAMYLAFVECRT